MSENLGNTKTAYQTLEEIPGIGPATVSKLKEIGFKTVESLSTATVDELVSAGLGEEISKKLIEAARQSRAITFVRGDSIREVPFTSFPAGLPFASFGLLNCFSTRKNC